MSSGKTAIVWLDPEQAPLMRAVLAAAELRIVAAGSARTGRSPEVAEALGLEASAATAPDDLRRVLTTCECDAVVLAAPGEFGGHTEAGEADLEALRACRARGVRLASLEPVPASALQLASPGWDTEAGDGEAGPAAEVVRFIPRWRLAGPMLAAAEILADFGPVRTAVLESWSCPHEGSLGARLLDAMDLALWLLGEPEQIDAAFAWPGVASAGLRKQAGETLRGLEGDLTAHLRYADGRSAAVSLSDHGARWGRIATLIGPNGRLRVFDDGLEWLDASGAKVDASRGGDAVRTSAAPVAPEHRSAAVMADALTRYVHDREQAVPPLDSRRVLTMTGAALLSARTGEGESPETIRRMNG